MVRHSHDMKRTTGMQSEPLAIAYHEAGHAVIAAAQRILGDESTPTIIRDGFIYVRPSAVLWLECL